MKMKNLRMTKVLSVTLFVLTLFVVGMTNALAQDQVATLQHNGEITSLYGANALIEAYDAAENGDVITLSGGRFVCPTDIDKPITIHGAGVLPDSISMTEATVLTGSNIRFRFGSLEDHLVIEGIDFSAVSNLCFYILSHAEFKRCTIGSIGVFGISDGTNNVCFTNCRIGYINCYRITNCLFINSMVFSADQLNLSQSTERNAIVYNSYFCLSGNQNVTFCNFTNSIVVGNGNAFPDASCNIINCVCVTNGYSSLLQNALHTNCMEVENLEDVFVDFTNNMNDPFVLKDEIATDFLGTDGTEVGIYGGMFPFYDIPKYMIMRRCNVGSRTTDDGHLSVDIEVVTEE